MHTQNRKSLWVLLSAAVFMLAFGASAAMADIKLSWEQPDIDENFWGWEVHTGSAPGGPYEMVTEVEYGGEAQPDYKWEITPSEFSGMTYFVVRARNTAGQVSEFSNEVQYLFESPAIPVNLRIVIVPDEEAPQ